VIALDDSGSQDKLAFHHDPVNRPPVAQLSVEVIESSASTTRTPSLPSVFSRYDLQLPDDVVTHLESADVGRVLGVSYQRAHQLAQ